MISKTVKHLYHRYTPLSRYQVVNQLKERTTVMTENIKKDLQTFIALTHNGWTSCATESYSTVTGHFITHNREIRSVVLQTLQIQGSHTSENIAGGLKGT